MILRTHSRSRQFSAFVLAFTLLSALAVTTWGASATSAHAELERAVPATNAVLAAPPESIELWTTEAVATNDSSPRIAVLDEEGRSLPIRDLQIDPEDPRHVTAQVDGVGFGVFTVQWTVTSDVDGHTLSGAYGFRVGGTSRAPGAATVEGETPRIWAVATRWLTFLGAAIAAAGFLIGLLLRGREGEADVTERRRLKLVLAGALIGIVATVAEPLLQAQFPPAGLSAPTVSQAFNALPGAWYIRVPALLIAIVYAGMLLGRDRGPLARRIFAVTGALAALFAILGLALTSHASARESWRAAAVASVIIHQWSVALWTGGLIQLLIARPFERDADRPMPIQRFSTYALGLAGAGVVTGAFNAGLILPTLASLWESDYGKVLIVKVLVLMPVLALAGYHRLTLKRALAQAAMKLRVTLRLETALLALVVLAGSSLALLAPPSVAKTTIASVDLAATLPDQADAFVRFVISPADTGENTLSVAVTQGAPRDFDANNVLVDAPPVADVQLVRVDLINLNQSTAPMTVDLTAEDDGWFRAERVQLGLTGWWRADVLVRRAGLEDAVASFYLLLPDPNVHGEEAPGQPASDPAAEAVFQTGLTGLTSLNSVHFVERLSGGTGTILYSDHTTLAGGEGQPAAMRIATSDSEMIRMDGYQWIRSATRDWIRTDANQVIPPSEWGTDYAGAIGFQLAGEEQIGERTAQRVIFNVPGDRLAPAWYVWWVDVESGWLLRETMVSTGHYMIRDYDQFNAAPPITPPTE